MPDTIASLRHYDPAQLLDQISDRLQLKNDAALARMLDIRSPMLSKVRHRRLPVGSALLIRIHEVTGLSIGELRALMGDRRAAFRITARPAPRNAANRQVQNVGGRKRGQP